MECRDFETTITLVTLRFLAYFERGIPHKNPGHGTVLHNARITLGQRSDSGMGGSPGVFAVALKRATTCLLCLMAPS